MMTCADMLASITRYETGGGMNHVSQTGSTHHRTRHYRRLLVMTGLHFVAMYVLMYAMVDVFGNVHHNLNQFYMAGLMTASMVLLELPLMRSMYRAKKWNVAIFAAGVALLVGFFLAIRQQGAVSDRQFLRSMIPHHASAILMCERNSIEDPQIRELCGNIVASQQAEIDWMTAKLTGSQTAGPPARQ
jgi:hypothetical protein